MFMSARIFPDGNLRSRSSPKSSSATTGNGNCAGCPISCSCPGIVSGLSPNPAAGQCRRSPIRRKENPERMRHSSASRTCRISEIRRAGAGTREYGSAFAEAPEGQERAEHGMALSSSMSHLIRRDAKNCIVFGFRSCFSWELRYISYYINAKTANGRNLPGWNL